MRPLNRRSFLAAASLGTGLALHANPTRASFNAADARIGGSKADIPTPALLVDLDLFEANLRVMAEHCQSRGARSPAARQDAQVPGDRPAPGGPRGARGVAVATVPKPRRWSRPGSRGYS